MRSIEDQGFLPVGLIERHFRIDQGILRRMLWKELRDGHRLLLTHLRGFIDHHVPDFLITHPVDSADPLHSFLDFRITLTITVISHPLL